MAAAEIRRTNAEVRRKINVKYRFGHLSLWRPQKYLVIHKNISLIRANKRICKDVKNISGETKKRPNLSQTAHSYMIN